MENLKDVLKYLESIPDKDKGNLNVPSNVKEYLNTPVVSGECPRYNIFDPSFMSSTSLFFLTRCYIMWPLDCIAYKTAAPSFTLNNTSSVLAKKQHPRIEFEKNYVANLKEHEVAKSICLYISSKIGSDCLHTLA